MATPTIEYVAAWATFGTALGTIGLGIATFALARRTRALAASGQETADAAKEELTLLGNQAESARRQSSAAEAALNASLRPLVIDVPRHSMRTIWVRDQGERRPEAVDSSVISATVRETTRTGSLTVPVRNVGSGAALGVAVAVSNYREKTAGGRIAEGEAPSVIPAGEADWLVFEDMEGAAAVAGVTPLVDLLRSEEDLVVEVAYSDAAGRQESATQLYLTRSGQIDRVYRVTTAVIGQPRRLTAE